MSEQIDKLKDKVEEYEDPVAKVAFLDGAVSMGVLISEEDGEEVPDYVKELQGVLDGLRRLIMLLPKLSKSEAKE